MKHNNYYIRISVNLKDGFQNLINTTQEVTEIGERHGLEWEGCGMALAKDSLRDVEFIYDIASEESLTSKLEVIKEELYSAGFTTVETYFEKE